MVSNRMLIVDSHNEYVASDVDWDNIVNDDVDTDNVDNNNDDDDDCCRLREF